MKESVEIRSHELLFDIRRSIRYHLRRQSFFSLLHKLVLLIGLIFGSVTVLALTEEWALWLKAIPTMLVTIAFACDLVIGFSQKAAQHTLFVYKFTMLERQIAPEAIDMNHELIDQVADARLSIEVDETRTLLVLDALCYNEVVRAMGLEENYQIKIKFWQKRFSNFFDLNTESLKNPESCV